MGTRGPGGSKELVGTANEEKKLPEGGRRRQKDADGKGLQWANSPLVPRTQVAGQNSNARLMWAGSHVLQSHLDLSDCVS